MSYFIEIDKKPKGVEGINLYLNAGWGTQADYVGQVKVFEDAYYNSHFVTARKDEKLIGMIRYFTDGFHDTQIIECLVLKDFQKQGVAKNMLNKLKEKYPDSAIYIQSTKVFEEAFLKEGFKKHQLVGLSYFKKGERMNIQKRTGYSELRETKKNIKKDYAT